MHRKIIPDLIRRTKPAGDGRVCELSESGTAFVASRKMAECDVAAIAITDGHGHLKGIVTERDLTRRVMGQGLDPKNTLLADIMTRDPDTLRPDDTAFSALESMKANNCRHMPVVDSLGCVVAMVSIRHMYKANKMDLEDDVRQVQAFVSDTGYGARN